MATDDLFRRRLDQMIDLRHPLSVLTHRIPWWQIEAALAPTLASKDRAGTVVWARAAWPGSSCRTSSSSVPVHPTVQRR